MRKALTILIIIGLSLFYGSNSHILVSQEEIEQKVEGTVECLASLNKSEETIEVIEEDKTEVAIAEVRVGKELWVKDRVELKKEPNTSSPSQVTYSKGTKLRAVGLTSNGWYRVTVGERLGYVLVDSLSETRVYAKGEIDYKPNQIYVVGKIVTYENIGKQDGQAYVDKYPKNAATWGGEYLFDSDDNKSTHFIGHNDGAFKGVGNTQMGDDITITDRDGKPFHYTVTGLLYVNRNGLTPGGIDMNSEISGSGNEEKITLQTCAPEKTWNYIIIAKPKMGQ